MRTLKTLALALLLTGSMLLAGCMNPYYVEQKDGRLWVFKKDSKELADYKATGDMAKRVTRIGAGPKGETVIAPDAETINGYLGK